MNFSFIHHGVKILLFLIILFYGVSDIYADIPIDTKLCTNCKPYITFTWQNKPGCDKDGITCIAYYPAEPQGANITKIYCRWWVKFQDDSNNWEEILGFAHSEDYMTVENNYGRWIEIYVVVYYVNSHGVRIYTLTSDTIHEIENCNQKPK